MISSKMKNTLKLKTSEDARKFISNLRSSAGYDSNLKRSADLKTAADRLFQDGRYEEAYACYHQAASAKNNYDMIITKAMAECLFAMSKKSPAPEDRNRYLEYIGAFRTQFDDVLARCYLELGYSIKTVEKLYTGKDFSRLLLPYYEENRKDFNEADLRETMQRLLQFQTYPERDEQLVTGRGPSWSATLCHLFNHCFWHFVLHEKQLHSLLNSMNFKLDNLFSKAACFNRLLFHVDPAEMHISEVNLLLALISFIACWGNREDENMLKAAEWFRIFETHSWLWPFLHHLGKSVASDQFKVALLSGEPDLFGDVFAMSVNCLLSATKLDNAMTKVMRRRRLPFPFDNLLWLFKIVQMADYLDLQNMASTMLLMITMNMSDMEFRKSLAKLPQSDFWSIVEVLIEQSAITFAKHAEAKFFRDKKPADREPSLSDEHRHQEMNSLWAMVNETVKPRLLRRSCVLQYFINQVEFFAENLYSLNSAGFHQLCQTVGFLSHVAEDAERASDLAEWTKCHGIGRIALKLVSCDFGNYCDMSDQTVIVDKLWSLLALFSSASPTFRDIFLEPLDISTRIFGNTMVYLQPGQLHCLALTLPNVPFEKQQARHLSESVFPQILQFFVALPDVNNGEESDADSIANCLIILDWMLNKLANFGELFKGKTLKPSHLLNAIFLTVDKGFAAVRRNQPESRSDILAGIEQM